MEIKVTYTEELKTQLHQVKRTTAELVKERPEKSLEQFLAEIEFVKGQLEEVKQMVSL